MNKIIINIKFAIVVILTTMPFVGTPVEVSAQTLVLKNEGVFIALDTLSSEDVFSPRQSVAIKRIDAKALQLNSRGDFTITSTSTSGTDSIIFQAKFKSSLSEKEIQKNNQSNPIILVAAKDYKIHMGDYEKELPAIKSNTTSTAKDSVANKDQTPKIDTDSSSSKCVKYIECCVKEHFGYIFIVLLVLFCVGGIVYKKKNCKGKKQKNPTEDSIINKNGPDEEDSSGVGSPVEECKPHIPDNTEDSNDSVESNCLSNASDENKKLKHENTALREILTVICGLLKLNKTVDNVLVDGASVICNKIQNLQNSVSAQENSDKSQDESQAEIYKKLLEVFNNEEHIGKLMQKTLGEPKSQLDLDTFRKFARNVESNLRNAEKKPETIDIESLLRKTDNQLALRNRVFEIMECAKLSVFNRNTTLQDNFEAIKELILKNTDENRVSEIVSEAVKNGNLTDEDKLVIAQNIERSVNALIKDSTKRLTNVYSYDSLINAVADRLQIPNSHEEAASRAQKNDVDVVNSVLGSSLQGIDKQSMETAVWGLVASFISKLGQDVNPDKDSIKEGVRTLKKFIEEVNELKKAIGADALSDVEKCVRQKELKRILDSNKTISALIPEASAAESTESLVNKLVRCISENNTAYELIVEELQKQLEKRQIPFDGSACTAVDLFASFTKDVAEKEKEQSATINEKIKEIETKQNKIDNQERTIADLNLERSELLKEAPESVANLQKLVENVRSHNVSVVRACSESEEDLCNSIDDKLFEGIHQSMDVLGSFKSKENDHPAAVKASIVVLIEQELSKENSAIATAYRYYAYSMLPFMTDDSRTHGIVFERRKMITLKESLDDLMTQFGVKVIVPPLFTMGVDEADYEDVTGKAYADLDNLCPGSRNHVDNVDTQKAPTKMVVDIHLVGYSINGDVKRKPQVLTF